MIFHIVSLGAYLHVGTALSLHFWSITGTGLSTTRKVLGSDFVGAGEGWQLCLGAYLRASP